MKKINYALNTLLLLLLLISFVSGLNIPPPPEATVTEDGMLIVTPDVRSIYILLHFLPLFVAFIIFLSTRRKPVWNGLLILFWGISYFFIKLTLMSVLDTAFVEPSLLIVFGALIFSVGIFHRKQKHFE